jgi:hypothetical protein
VHRLPKVCVAQIPESLNLSQFVGA